MFYQFLEQTKPILKASISYSEKIFQIIQLPSFYPIFAIGFIGSIFVNYLIIKQIYCLIKESKKISWNLEKTHFTFKECGLIIVGFTLMTIALYHKIIFKINQEIFANGGDSFNHYARLKNSKEILTNSKLSIFHWDGIFFPDGLTAFDAPPTLYNDLIHLFLSYFVNSILIYNLIHLSTFVLAGFFTYLLARELKYSKSTSFFSGALFSFSQYHLFAAHLWINITHIELIPLILFLYVRADKNKYSIKDKLIITIALTALGNQSLYFYFMLLFYLSLIFLVVKKITLKKVLDYFIPIFISLILMSYWLIPMVNDPTIEKTPYIPHFSYTLDIFKMIFGDSSILIFNNYSKNPIFIGLPIFLFSIYCFIKSKNYFLRLNILFLFVMGLGSFLKFNDSLYPIVLPEIFISILPIYKSIRATERYLIFLIIPIGLLLGNYFESNNICKKIKYPLMIFILVSIWQIPDHSINVKPPLIYQKIPTKPDPNVGVLELPLNRPYYWMWQAEHHHPIVYGYLFIRGKKNKLFHEIRKDIVIKETIDLDRLKIKGVKYIISHHNVYESLYAEELGFPQRKDKLFKGIKQYISTEEMNKLELLYEDKQYTLHKIK